MFDFFPVFEINDKYILRAPRVDYDEAQSSFDCYQDEKVRPFVPNNCLPKSLSEAHSELQYLSDMFFKKEGFYWIIAKKNDDALIGKIGFHDWHKLHSRLGISYQLKSEYWNNGIMSSALRIVIRFAFCKMQIERIEANTVIGNDVSAHILQKVGFKLEGILRSYRFYNGKNVDIMMFGYTKKQYFACTDLQKNNNRSAKKNMSSNVYYQYNCK